MSWSASRGRPTDRRSPGRPCLGGDLSSAHFVTSRAKLEAALHDIQAEMESRSRSSRRRTNCSKHHGPNRQECVRAGRTGLTSRPVSRRERESLSSRGPCSYILLSADEALRFEQCVLRLEDLDLLFHFAWMSWRAAPACPTGHEIARWIKSPPRHGRQDFARSWVDLGVRSSHHPRTRLAPRSLETTVHLERGRRARGTCRRQVRSHCARNKCRSAPQDLVALVGLARAS